MPSTDKNDNVNQIKRNENVTIFCLVPLYQHFNRIGAVAEASCQKGNPATKMSDTVILLMVMINRIKYIALMLQKGL